MSTQQLSFQQKMLKWLRKVGFWGFMFFLVKGLVWLVVGYWIVK